MEQIYPSKNLNHKSYPQQTTRVCNEKICCSSNE
uniref:Uncharacterized protein n=1 Tax=Rhizophora mucronata TaxID=61149 RepID=A0A2P2MNJ0_RHIMU